jgi:hypothetical protein
MCLTLPMLLEGKLLDCLSDSIGWEVGSPSLFL